MEVRLAGSFGIRRGNTELAEQAAGSRKSRLLLKLLAVERPALVPVDRIADVLWAGYPPPAAPQNTATLVSRLRGVLGADVIAGGRAGYRLAGDGVVSVDLDAAARYCDQAERKLTSAPALALAAASRAAGLLGGGTALADEPDADWTAPARAELTGLLRRARLLAAQAALAGRDPHQAAEHAAAAMTADPLDEAAHRWFMSACAAAGEPARPLASYAALRERLAAELGTDPAAQTQDLHLAILREEQPGAGEPEPAGQLAGLPGRERDVRDGRERLGPGRDPRRGPGREHDAGDGRGRPGRDAQGARAWVDWDDPERARATLAPLLAVTERVPWTATLAAGLVADGRALGRLGERAQARSAPRRASELAGAHGLPHIYTDARAAAAELS